MVGQCCKASSKQILISVDQRDFSIQWRFYETSQRKKRRIFSWNWCSVAWKIT